MSHSALDPLRVPAELWQRADVDDALARRDIGALLRLVHKYARGSQTQIGIAVGMAQGTVSRIMQGRRDVTALDVLERIAEGLDMPDAARQRLGLAPCSQHPADERAEETDPTKRRTALGLGLAAVLDPASLRAVLREAAAEAMEFTSETTTPGVGTGTFDHLEAVVADLNRAYSREPPHERFVVARAYRQRVAQLLCGRRTLTEARELHVYAAWLSEVLAWLAHDLGSPLAAEAYAIDCYEHADQAGHDELCAWAADAMASIALYTDRPAKAVTAARKGIWKTSSAHPLAVRLCAQAARAHARLGQADECATLLTEVAELHERLPAQAPTRFSLDTGTLATYAVTAYTASSYLWLGEHGRAETHARAALAVHESAPPASRSPSREAIARIDLALALVHQRQPDEAAALGRQALGSTRVVESVLARAGELGAAMITAYPQLPGTRDFHEQYRQLAAPASTNEEPQS